MGNSLYLFIYLYLYLIQPFIFIMYYIFKSFSYQRKISFDLLGFGSFILTERYMYRADIQSVSD